MNLPLDLYQINSPPKTWAPEAGGDEGAAPHGNKTLNARAPVEVLDEDRWDHSLMSIPPGGVAENGYWDPATGEWKTTFDESGCEGQIIYLVEEDVMNTHQVSNRPLLPPSGNQYTAEHQGGEESMG